MRHQKKRHRLGRSHAHRKATLAALSTALIAHKRITTTVTRAKALRMYVEPLLNRAKEDTTHNRREVFRHLQNKQAVTELFGDVASKIGDRPGGYTRVVKLGHRAGDAAEMAVIELVDYNDVRPGGAAGGGRKRRTRRGTSGGGRKRSTESKPATQAKAATAAAKAKKESTAASEVDTGAVETPVAEEQQTPVAEQTQPTAETQETTEDAAEETGTAEASGAETAEPSDAEVDEPEAGSDEEEGEAKK